MRFHHLLMLALTVLLGASHYLGYTPLVLGLIFFLASVIAYFLYAKDKAAAKTSSWRVSEKTLHVSALLFGWPGALVAQERLRHKTKKQSFRTVFWLTVLVNLGGVAWLHSSQGNTQLREGMYQLERLAVANMPQGASVSTLLFLTSFRTGEVE